MADSEECVGAIQEQLLRERGVRGKVARAAAPETAPQPMSVESRAVGRGDEAGHPIGAAISAPAVACLSIDPLDPIRARIEGLEVQGATGAFKFDEVLI